MYMIEDRFKYDNDMILYRYRYDIIYIYILYINYFTYLYLRIYLIVYYAHYLYILYTHNIYIYIYIYTYTCILHICMSIYYDQWLLLYHCCPSPSLNARHGLEMWKTGEAVAERRCRGNSPQDPTIFEEIEDLRSLLNVVEGIKKPAFFLLRIIFDGF